MITLLSSTNDRHVIRLNRAFRADLAWWRMLAANWNGTGLIPQDGTTPSTTLFTDVSGSWGCGAFWNQRWLQFHWSESAAPLPISMLPIKMAAATWGVQWRGQCVACYCDNQAVVATLASRSSKEERLAHLLRCLFYFEALYQFELRGFHGTYRAPRIELPMPCHVTISMCSSNMSPGRIPTRTPSHLGWWKRC